MQAIKHPDVPSMLEALRVKGMRQEDISKATGFSQNFISDLKRGRSGFRRSANYIRLFALYAERVLGQRLALVPLPRRGASKPRQAARRCA